MDNEMEEITVKIIKSGTDSLNIKCVCMTEH